jgi:hypothetical protein
MSYEAEQQIVKALRSLPWYMFLVPAFHTQALVHRFCGKLEELDTCSAGRQGDICRFAMQIIIRNSAARSAVNIAKPQPTFIAAAVFRRMNWSFAII